MIICSAILGVAMTCLAIYWFAKDWRRRKTLRLDSAQIVTSTLVLVQASTTYQSNKQYSFIEDETVVVLY